MTQPLDVAYVEIVSNSDKVYKDIQTDADKAFKNVEQSAQRASDNVASSFKDAANGISGSFRDVNGRLRDSNGRFLSMGKVGKEALEGISGAGQAASDSLNLTLRGMNSLLGAVGQLAAAGPAGIAILAAAFILLAGAVAVAARVVQDLISIAQFGIALLPGLIVGVISAFGILKAATAGVSEAFEEQTKKATAAGSAGVNSARQIADAQRGVRQAQKDLIKAREEEIKRIRTLAIEVLRARVTEARAADDVLKAEHALQRARQVGTPRAQIEAQLALDEARATLVEAKQDTKDLAAEKAKADKNGVNGSEQVLRAQEALLDAQDRLAASQQRISAGAAAQNTAFNSLTKSAQDFVRALISAKEQLGPVQKALQEALFRGTAPLIQPIVDNIKELQPELVQVADGFNAIFKEVLKFLGSPEAKEALSNLLKGMSDFLKAVTPSIGPLLKSFAGLVGNSGEFGKILGEKVANALDKIAQFVSEVDLNKLFEDAKEAIKELAPIVRDVSSILRDVFRLLALAGEVILPSVALNLRIVTSAIDNFGVKWDIVTTKFSEFFEFVRRKLHLSSGDIVNTISALPGKIAALGGKFLEAGKKIMASFFAGLSTAGGFVKDFSKNLAGAFISFFNRNVIANINAGIKKIQNGLNSIPGLNLSLPSLANIPALQAGGVSTKNTIAQISENNRKEGILPLENSRAMQMVGKAIADAGGTRQAETVMFAPGAFVLNFSGALPTEAQARNIGTTIGRAAGAALERRNIRTRLRSM